jgi:phosphatidylglycerol:prolipoprotein diacylglycerol transferase
MSPILFHIGSTPIYAYGTFYGLAFVAGVWLAAHLAEEDGVDPDVVWTLAWLVPPAGLVGGFLLQALVDVGQYLDHPAELFSLARLQSAGAFYGGLAVGGLTWAWWMRRNRLPLAAMADACVPGLVLGLAIVRTGCFFAGCCFGKATTLPWGVTFTDPLARQWNGTPLGCPLHPTQLYEAAAGLVICGVLLALRRRALLRGRLLLVFLALYAVCRFAIEAFRDDPRGSYLGGSLSTSQLVSLVLLPVALVILARPAPASSAATAADAAATAGRSGRKRGERRDGPSGE